MVSISTPPPRLIHHLTQVSVGQKTSGYVAGTLAFTPPLLQALDFVDASLSKVIQALNYASIADSTLVILASKHGQAPIDPTKFSEVDPQSVTNATGVDVLFQTSDDIALIFLADQSPANVAKAVAGLEAQKTALKIQEIIAGPQELIARGLGNPLTDSAVPDIIVVPIEGVIYTTSKSKIAE